MVIRKHGKKWQCLVRVKGVAVTQSFISKSDARLWGQKTEVDIINGVYLKNLKLVEMRVKDLLLLVMGILSGQEWKRTGTMIRILLMIMRYF